MRITFCLPSIRREPVGGYKIVYEYANRLSERGHDITILYFSDLNMQKIPFNVIKASIGNLLLTRPIKWFKLNKKIRLVSTPYVDKSSVFPDSDIIFATTPRTANCINSLPYSKGKKFYIIQAYENWGTSEENLIETYRFPFRKIVVSKWLHDKIVDKSGQDSVVISNPIDSKDFYVEEPIETRNNLVVSLLYHKSHQKGTSVALDALTKVRKIYPELKVQMFGSVEKGEEVPNWVDYTFQANSEQLRKIYNKSSIFLCASYEEGFGLTGAESMACGNALVSTNFLGVKEYAISEKNSLLSVVGDSQKLADNVIKLIENNELRVTLAKQGSIDILNRSWNKAVTKLELLMLRSLFDSSEDKV